MKNIIKSAKLVFLILSLTGLFLAACGATPIPQDLPPTRTTAPSPTLTTTPLTAPTETFTPTASPSPIPQSAALFIADPVPQGLMDLESLPLEETSEIAAADLWLGSGAGPAAEETLAVASWTYVLAAPFPTLIDEVSEESLAAFWRGTPQNELAELKTLYVSPAIAAALDELWGAYSSLTVKIRSTLPQPQALWQEDKAWMIVPFEALDPQLKVIRVDGVSPLDFGFEPENDPLTIAFRLTLINGHEVSREDREALLSGFNITNRDPDKTTTLVMTGVTALVRATAYKMEINGIRYPAEAILPWLREADLTHISNEVSFYENCPFPDPNQRAIFFCSNPGYIELFDYIDADIIELTGNHNNDSWYVYGVDVVPFSLNLYRERDMIYYGGGENLADALSPATITHNGNKLAFIGCNASGPDYAWATPDRGGSAPCDDYQWMADEVNRLREAGYLPIVTFQYYENYSNIPSETQIVDFGLMAEAGAVIVNGSQAHRPKGMAFDDGAFIDYGLGNLFFDQMGVTINGNLIEQTRWEIIQRHTFYNGRHLSTELLTAMLEDYAQPRPMTPAERQRFLSELFSASGWDYAVK